MTTLQAAIGNRFERQNRLPGQVFKDPDRLRFLLTDSALITDAECWQILQMLARRFEDRAVVAEVVEDLHEGGASPLAPLVTAANGSGEAFVRWLRQRQDARIEPLYIDARIVAVGGDSAAWGLWFDQDKELAVLGVPSATLDPVRDQLAAVSTWPWHEASNVAELLGPAFEPQGVPDELVREIKRSYASVRVSE